MPKLVVLAQTVRTYTYGDPPGKWAPYIPPFRVIHRSSEATWIDRLFQAIQNVQENRRQSKQAVRGAATIPPPPCKLTFGLLTLKVVSESL